MAKLLDNEVITPRSPRRRQVRLPYHVRPSPDSMHPAPSNLPLIPEGLLFIIGLATTALGIAITRTDQQFDWVPAQVYDFLRRYFPNPQAVFLGGVVSLVGAALAGLAGRRNTQPDNLAGLALPIPSFPSQAQDLAQTGLLRRDPFVPGAFALATLCSGFLYWQLASQQYTHWDILLFFVGLALVGFAIHRLDKPEQASAKGSNPSFASSGQALPTFQPSNLPTLPSQARGRLFNFPTDLLASLGLAIFSIVINSIDLIRWDFSFVADEGEFFSAAHQVVNGGPWNFFNLTWVYNSHPALDSVYQGMVMKVVGDNVIGWRFSEVLVTAITVALIYLLGVALLGRLPALAAGIFIASSNYLMAFNRIAYNNTHVIFYSTLAVLMLVMAWRTQRAVFVFATGVAMGFCLYTFLSAIFLWPALALFLLIIFLRKPTWGQVFAGLLMLLGFALVVTPALITTPPDALLQMALLNTYATSAASVSPDPVSRGLISLELSSISFWVVSGHWNNHYLGGPLLDVISGVLVLVGFFTALFRIHKRTERLVLTWVVVGMALLSFTDFFTEPHVTRMFIVLPAVALLMGIAVSKLDGVLRAGLRLRASTRIRPYVAYALILVLLALVPALNLRQLLVEDPSLMSTPVNTQMMLMKAIQEHPNYSIVEVGAGFQPNAQTPRVMSWYPWYEGRYRYTPLSGLEEPFPEGSEGNLPIYLVSDENKDIVQSVHNKLLGSSYLLAVDTDRAGVPRTSLFIPTTRPTSQQPAPNLSKGLAGSPPALIPELAVEVHIPSLSDGKPSEPRDVTVDSQGNFYVITDVEGIIRKYDPSGKLLLSWGNTANSANSTPLFKGLFGIAIDDNDVIYALDADTASILRFDTKGKQLGEAITGVGYYPRGISITAKGEVLIADTGFNEVSLIKPDSKLRTGVEVDKNMGPLREPSDAVTADNGDLFMVDTGNTRVAHFSIAGNFINQWAIEKPPSPRDSGHIALDAHGRLFETSPNDRQVIIHDAQGVTGKVLGRWTAYMSEIPVGIYVDKQDNVYVTYPAFDIVRKFRLRR